MTTFSRMRAPVMTIAAAFLFSACAQVETAPPTQENAPSAATENTPAPAVTQTSPVSDTDLETAALLLANAFDSAKGEYSGAFRRLGARSEGKTVIIESRITRTYAYVEPSRARRQLRASICDDNVTKSFVDAGGAFQFVFLRRSSVRGSETVRISSC